MKTPAFIVNFFTKLKEKKQLQIDKQINKILEAESKIIPILVERIKIDTVERTHENELKIIDLEFELKSIVNHFTLDVKQYALLSSTLLWETIYKNKIADTFSFIELEIIKELKKDNIDYHSLEFKEAFQTLKKL